MRLLEAIKKVVCAFELLKNSEMAVEPIICMVEASVCYVRLFSDFFIKC